jgi:alpha-L-fucosidase
LDIEAGDLDEAQEDVWQTDISLGTNHSWAYSPDAVSRPVNDIVDEIVERKSMNGVTLLSLAPKADGTLPPSQVETMKKLGKWMVINKPALYASKPAPFVTGGVDVSKAGSMRFTMKGNFLYAIDLEKPKAPHVIPGVKPVKDSAVTMLGSSKNLPWHQEGNDLVIEEIPDPLPCDYAWSFKIQVLQQKL